MLYSATYAEVCPQQRRHLGVALLQRSIERRLAILPRWRGERRVGRSSAFSSTDITTHRVLCPNVDPVARQEEARCLGVAKEGRVVERRRAILRRGGVGEAAA